MSFWESETDWRSLKQWEYWIISSFSFPFWVQQRAVKLCFIININYLADSYGCGSSCLCLLAAFLFFLFLFPVLENIFPSPPLYTLNVLNQWFYFLSFSHWSVSLFISISERIKIDNIENVTIPKAKDKSTSILTRMFQLFLMLETCKNISRVLSLQEIQMRDVGKGWCKKIKQDMSYARSFSGWTAEFWFQPVPHDAQN